MLVYCWWIQLAVAEKEEISKSSSGKLSPVGFYIPPFCSIQIFLTCTINTPFMFPTLTVLFFWKLILRNQIVRNRKGVLQLKSQPFPLHSGLFLQTCMLCTRYFRGVLWDSSPEKPEPRNPIVIKRPVRSIKVFTWTTREGWQFFASKCLQWFLVDYLNPPKMASHQSDYWLTSSTCNMFEEGAMGFEMCKPVTPGSIQRAGQSPW